MLRTVPHTIEFPLQKCLWTLLGSNQRPYACESSAGVTYGSATTISGRRKEIKSLVEDDLRGCLFCFACINAFNILLASSALAIPLCHLISLWFKFIPASRERHSPNFVVFFLYFLQKNSFESQRERLHFQQCSWVDKKWAGRFLLARLLWHSVRDAPFPRVLKNAHECTVVLQMDGPTDKQRRVIK